MANGGLQQPGRTMQIHTARVTWMDGTVITYPCKSAWVEQNVLRLDPVDSWLETRYIPLYSVREFQTGNAVAPVQEESQEPK